MSQFEISKEALVVKLSISAFSLKGASETIREEAAEKHNADKASIDAGLRIFQYQDIPARDTDGKVVENSRLKGSGITNILAIRTKAKKIWKDHTLAWEDGARRICLSKRYPALRAKLDECANAFRDAVQVWLSHYPAIKADFYARLNGLSKEIEFTTLEKLQDKFHFDVDLDRINDPKDVRWAHIGEADTLKIQEQVENRIRERLKATQCEIVERIQVVLEKLQKTCSDGEAAFKNSLIGNVRDLVSILPDLNVLGDARIGDLIERTTKLAETDAQKIREDAGVRSEVVVGASNILADLLGFQPKV